MGIAALIFYDVVYSQNKDRSYKFDNNNGFTKCNINTTMDYIKNCVEAFFRSAAHDNPFLNKCKPSINYIALRQALERYARDVFGQQRFAAQLNSKFGKESKFIIENREKYGFKIHSRNPYIHRRAANFFYWFSMLKPFSIEIIDFNLVVPDEKKYITGFFNELCSFSLVKSMLGGCKIKDCKMQNCSYKGCCTLQIDIEDDPLVFKDFLYDIHFRNLSRSSLELSLSKSINVKNSKDSCPLNNFSLTKQYEMFAIEDNVL